MKLLLAIAIYLCATSGSYSLPVLTGDSSVEDLMAAIDQIVIAMKLPDVPTGLEKMSADQLMACFPKEMEKMMPPLKILCGEKVQDFSVQSMSQCFLLTAGILDSATGQVDMAKFNAMNKDILAKSTLSPAQQTGLQTSLETCVASSDFVVPAEYYSVPVQAKGNHDKKNDPLRILACASKATLQNGCPGNNGKK